MRDIDLARSADIPDGSKLEPNVFGAERVFGCLNSGPVAAITNSFLPVRRLISTAKRVVGLQNHSNSHDFDP